MLLVLEVAQAQTATFSIRGTLQDDQKAPIPFGNVALYQSADSVLVTGAVSDAAGQFAIKAKPGQYYVKVTVLSYAEKLIPNVQVTNRDLALGTLTLRSDAEYLEEVVVKGQKSQMVLELDKRVFNVGQDLANIGGNAADILNNVPSVAVDVDGNVSLRGSGNVRILVNGKPSGLVGPDALRQLQGNLVESIEVITNPSSRYDAEGEVGIINIILKKESQRGVNGSFSANVGYPANHGGSFNLNFRREKFNLFTSYGINYRKSPGRGSSYQRFFSDDTLYAYEQTSTRTRGGLSHNVQAGLDYFLTEQDILTASVFLRLADGNNTSEYEYRDFGERDELLRTVLRQEQEAEPRTNVETTFSYRHEFDRKGRLLTADFKWIEQDEIEKAEFQQRELGLPDVLRQRSRNTEDERNWLFQADYVHPFSEKGKWETGVRSTNRILHNDFSVEQQDEVGNWGILSSYDNNLIYTERIHAGYLMASEKFSKFSIQGGLRGEYSDITTDLPDDNLVNNRQYFNLFPSTHFSYALTPEKSIQLSYSYRLSRPGFRDLLPYSGFSDNRSLRVGNPNLNPEYTHSIEGGYLLNWDNGSLLASGYYRYRTGVIERIVLVDSVGFSRMFPVNLATQNAYGLEGNVSYSPWKWWRLNTNFNFYRAITEGTYQEQRLFSDTYTWQTRSTSQMTLWQTWEFQAGINYRAPQRTPQGRDLSTYAIDLGLSRDILKGNGTLVFSVQDLLNTRKRRSIVEREGYYSTSTFQWRSRQALVTFNYRLNQRKNERGRNRDAFEEEGGGDF